VNGRVLNSELLLRDECKECENSQRNARWAKVAAI